MMDPEAFGAQIGKAARAAIEREIAQIKIGLMQELTALRLELAAIKAAPPADPLPPIAVKSAQILADGTLSLVLSDGTTLDAGHVIGPAGEKGEPGDKGEPGAEGQPGKDGADGIGFDDLFFEMLDERHFKAVAKREGKTIEQVFRVPALVYRGIYTPETAYEPGDVATYAGSMWVAEKDQPGKPQEGKDSGWRLAVKHGRNGRDFEVRDTPKGVKL